MKRIINTFKYGTPGVKLMLAGTILAGCISAGCIIAAFVTSIMAFFFGGAVMFFVTIALAQTMGIREDVHNEIKQETTPAKNNKNKIKKADKKLADKMYAVPDSDKVIEPPLRSSKKSKKTMESEKTEPENESVEQEHEAAEQPYEPQEQEYEAGEQPYEPQEQEYETAEQPYEPQEQPYEDAGYNHEAYMADTPEEVSDTEEPKYDVESEQEAYEADHADTETKNKKKARKEKKVKEKKAAEPKKTDKKSRKKNSLKKSSEDETAQINISMDADSVDRVDMAPDETVRMNYIDTSEDPNAARFTNEDGFGEETIHITEKALKQYDSKKKLKKVFHKYKVKRDHRMVMVDHCDKLNILQTPGFIWVDKNTFNLLLIGEEPRHITFPIHTLNQITYLKKYPAREYSEYAVFRNFNGILVEMFKPYLPDYARSTVVGDMSSTKNLYGIGPGIYFTNTSAKHLFDLLAAEFYVKDKVTKSNKVNVYFKEAYMANIRLRDNVVDANGYADIISGILNNLARSTISYNEFKDTINLLVKNKFITQEFATHYMSVRDKYGK